MSSIFNVDHHGMKEICIFRPTASLAINFNLTKPNLTHHSIGLFRPFKLGYVMIT